jgi:hypothetical protein
VIDQLIARGTLTLAMSVIVGCTAKPVTPATAIDLSNLNVAVVSSSQWTFNWQTKDVAETDLANCLGDALAEAYPELVVIPETTFVQTIFPDLPAALAPRSPEYIKLALTHPDVRERIATLNLKYLVYVAGTREMERNWRDLEVACVGGYNVAWCGGGIILEQTSRLTAVIIDVETTRELNSIRASDSGTSWIVMPFLPITVWHMTDTREPSCQELSHELVYALRTQTDWRSTLPEGD